MKRIIFTILIILILSPTNIKAEKIDCTRYEKISSKYLECTAKNLKEKSEIFRLKATVGTEMLKENIATNVKDSKKKFNKSKLNEILIKFKNSKTLTEFMEK